MVYCYKSQEGWAKLKVPTLIFPSTPVLDLATSNAISLPFNTVEITITDCT